MMRIIFHKAPIDLPGHDGSSTPQTEAAWIFPVWFVRPGNKPRIPG